MVDSNTEHPVRPDAQMCRECSTLLYVMTVAVGAAPPASTHRVRPSRTRQDRSTRRRLDEQDRGSAHLAEVHAMADLLDRAADVLDQGWAQGVWFRPRAAAGGPVPRPDQLTSSDGPGPGACLVGAIVQAAGGRRAVHTQLVQRTLDLTWHTLYRRPDEPVRWCPGPTARQAQVRDLTRWNDHHARRQEEVTALLRAARNGARRELTPAR